MLRHAAFGKFSYKVRSGSTYILQTQPLTFSEAQRSCQEGGGQLASLPSQAEQAEVEGWALAQSYLLPAFHASYWLGLTAASDKSWPVFSWLDGKPLGYTNWGRWAMWGSSRLCRRVQLEVALHARCLH